MHILLLLIPWSYVEYLNILDMNIAQQNKYCLVFLSAKTLQYLKSLAAIPHFVS